MKDLSRESNVMHEGNFTEQIVKTILSELSAHPECQPKRVKVKVGEMFHLDSESVKMHYELQTRDTPLEHCALDLTEMPVQIQCGYCRREGSVEDHHWIVCPKCGSSKVKIVTGNEIVVESIEGTS